ncbi:SMR family transporter [Clostridium algidicarnis]|uniref:SMR family transporter n=1 Tax=Clostridium algidicarnis TaxID=37659 RepID=UPI001C0C203C|nr:SMR family transporter [Clostridium algidicarnis]MBU3209436.1 EamA family transporter [Clostridium algidicarnis]MBU3227314.1 EamA family transporter [Clostridium algidicarnis]MBU3250837.1 EamA family transporter [Clostridium algidicarnis]
MGYLFLAIVCSSSIALIFKYSEGSKMNRYAVTSVNYFTALFISLLMIIAKPSTKIHISDISIKGFILECSKVLSQNYVYFSPESSFTWALVVGIIGGAFFFLSFIYYQKSVRENGASLSGTFGKLGILVPMIFSILFWKEIPKPFQWVGILIALFSIVFANISYDENNNRSINLTLILLFLFGGMAEFQNKLFQKYALLEYKDVFLFVTFTMAFLLSLYFVLKSKEKILKRDLLTGFLVGIPNLFSSYFLIMALNSVNTSIALPVYSAGSIIFISLGEVLLYKEKLSNKNKIAVGLVVFALVLINI